MLCQRIESTKPHSKGGWFHAYDKTLPMVTLPKPKPAPPKINAAAILLAYKSKRSINELAIKLGVSVDSLQALNVEWSETSKAWAFPMFDGDGTMIGIRLRNETGDKWAVTGSRQGIFLPSKMVTNGNAPKIAFLPEGPTDTAALLTLGFFAIGRPTCNSGNEMIAQALKRLKIFKVVVVSDNDGIKVTGQRPGIEGAMKLKKELKLSSIIWMPPAPIKDVREYLNKGGTKQMIESDIRCKVWTKV